MDQQDRGTPIVGRDREMLQLRQYLTGESADQVLLMTGGPGMGRSVMLGWVHQEAAARAWTVLRAEGSTSEASMAFGVLHQLLRPVRSLAERLSPRQHSALRAAFGENDSDGGTDAGEVMLVGMAALNLLSGAGKEQPVLLMVDDADLADRASLTVLAFVLRRLHGEAVRLLMSAPPDRLVPGFARDIPRLHLGRLGDLEAGHLLDRQPVPPPRRIRARILEQAAGTPLALVELARTATSSHHRADDGRQAGPLPVADHLVDALLNPLDTLPAGTASALLTLSVLEESDIAIAIADRQLDPLEDVWNAAVEAGLLLRSSQDLRFRHPLTRSAMYHRAPWPARDQAHTRAALMLHTAPDRRAWHYSATVQGSDPQVADDLVRTATAARQRGGDAAMAAALQRAADLTADRQSASRLLVQAATAAAHTTDLAWTEELVNRARSLTADPGVLAVGAMQVARLAVLTQRPSAVFTRLITAARPLIPEQPAAALELLAGAAVVAFYTGDEHYRREVREILEHVPPRERDGSRGIWITVVTDPGAGHSHLQQRLHAALRPSDSAPQSLISAGIAFWLLDDLRAAGRALDSASEHWSTAHGRLPDGLGGAVAWAYLDQGRWSKAREICLQIETLAGVHGLEHATACAWAVDAVILALQGDTDLAIARARQSLSRIGPGDSGSVAVYARRALGIAAAAQGSPEAAFEQFRAVFDADGAPRHYHASLPVIADLASAAARTGRVQQAWPVVGHVAALLGEHASPRMRRLVLRAQALLNDGDQAEILFRQALAVPETDLWPFEQAQTLLDLAVWLRRRRRIGEARGPLAQAQEIFTRLGARPWAQAAETELRAAGMHPRPVAGALAGLSPQQQQIITLAAAGLTNREIGERLFLSPRTVGSHLYRSFPRLGITARSQLRDLLDVPPRAEAVR